MELLQGCRALCVAATEDFGITPLEANAAGKPVVAYGDGGALETVRDGVTGTFFHTLDEASLLDALRRADQLQTTPDQLAEHASTFAAPAFRNRIKQLVVRGAQPAPGSSPSADSRPDQ